MRPAEVVRLQAIAIPEARERSKTLEYRPAIDGLRAIAVLSVFVFHLNDRWLPGGFVGVDVFFVISGYLITQIIYKECEQSSFTLSGFYQRRIARLFPAFFTVALATLTGACLIYSPQDFASAGANLAASSLSVANLKSMFQGNYFEMSSDAQPYLHYWSLSVEEQFYLFFPLLFLLLFNFARKHLLLVLGGLCAASFLTALVLTQAKPVWAFYLLPTRAWELLVGSVLAVACLRSPTSFESRWSGTIAFFSLVLIVMSFFLIREGRNFPGFWALLPVLGSVGLLLPRKGNALTEKCLSIAPLVAVGHVSYSLYLWHWPIFSFVDYQLYLTSESTRVILKISLSLTAAWLCFRFIENPARIFLTQQSRRKLAFSSMFFVLAISVPLGIFIRKSNYINAESGSVRSGGLVFQSKENRSSVILMGDSNGSMYAKLLKEICAELDYELRVISVAAGDPLPDSQLWHDSLAVVEKERPDYLILGCDWETKLRDGKNRVRDAIEKLKPICGRLVILNQPPILPDHARRSGIRNGSRPPFYENPDIRRWRLELNHLLEQFASNNCVVLDVASRFQSADGEVLVIDAQGRLLYQDPEHLSGYGADLVRAELKRTVSPPD
jgi:peptidoglycan/LPS O-acetylase OafA/YrhL